MSISQQDLDSIQVLYRQDDTMGLWGIPYRMRPGQQPLDLKRAGNTRGWIWLGSPGWWGSKTKEEQELIKNWLAQFRKGDIPGGPHEWTYVDKMRRANPGKTLRDLMVGYKRPHDVGQRYYLAYPDEVVEVEVTATNPYMRQSRRYPSDPVSVYHLRDQEEFTTSRSSLFTDPMAAAADSARQMAEIEAEEAAMMREQPLRRHNPGTYRVRVKQFGSPAREMIAVHGQDYQWYDIEGRPLETGGAYVQEMLEKVEENPEPRENPMRLTVRDKKVIAAFLRHEQDSSKKLTSLGHRLDGNWMGGRNIASWDGQRVVFHDLGSRAAQTVQRYIKTKIGTQDMINRRNPASDFDEAAATELKIYIDNDAQLYRQRKQPIELNLSKKWKKGTYDEALAAKAYMYLVDDGAKKYVKEFGGTWNRMFTPATRREVARQFAEEFTVEARLGNLAENPRISGGRSNSVPMLERKDGLGLIEKRSSPVPGVERRNPTDKLIKISYEIITPESAAEGEVAESGWVDEDGEDMTLDEYDEEEGITAVDKAVEFLRDEGAVEPSASPFRKGVWYTKYGQQDPYSADVENKAYHLKGFTEEEERRIFEAMTSRRNPTPFTAKGKRMMRHIEKRSSPGIAAATVYSAAKRGTPGLVKKKWAKEHGYPTKKNPAANDFQEGAAKALWASLFSTELELLKEDGYEDLAYELHSGGEIMDDLPPIPEAAYDDAKAFEKALVKANGVRSIGDLIQRAADADGADVDEEEFGHYTMMPALGEGVSWFDDHGDFVLKLPHWEQSSEVHNAMFDFLEERKADYENE